MDQQAGKDLDLVLAGEGIADILKIPDPPHILQDPLHAAAGHLETGVEVNLPAIPDAVGDQEIGVAGLPLVVAVVQGEDVGLTVDVVKIGRTMGNEVAAGNDVIFIDGDGIGQAAALDYRLDAGSGPELFPFFCDI